MRGKFFLNTLLLDLTWRNVRNNIHKLFSFLIHFAYKKISFILHRDTSDFLYKNFFIFYCALILCYFLAERCKLIKN